MHKQLTKTTHVLYKEGNENTLAYLIIDQDEAVLIEPGHMNELDEIYGDIESLINPKKITHIIISHPNPDLTTSLSAYKERLSDFTVVTEWRTKNILERYGLDLNFYFIKENQFKLTLKSGRKLIFLLTPFAHYAGAFLTYDTQSKSLYTGDLFGAIHGSKQLVANDNYIDAMSLFHENYMPSSDFIRPVMKKLMDMDINVICPQHGAIIKGDMIHKSILYLYNLDFYNTLRTDHQISSDDDLDFHTRLIQIVIRLRQLFSDERIIETFNDSQIQIKLHPVDIQSDLSGYPLWHRFFEIIYAKNGDQWINAIESLVNRIVRLYHIEEPQIYQLRMRELEQQQKEISKKYNDLQSTMDQMETSITETKDQLLRCPITDLYRKEMAKSYIKENLDQLLNKSFLINFNIDQIIEINQDYSTKTGDDTMLMLKYLISNQLDKHQLLFRGVGSSFILLIQDDDELKVYKQAEQLRNLVSKHEQFIKQISISMGMIKLSDENFIHPDQLLNDWFSKVETRMKLAMKQSNGTIIYDDKQQNVFYRNNILLVDEEQVNINLITQYMENEGYRVYHAINPFEALKVIEEYRIDLIISEINLSKLDGFALKKKLNEQTKFANTPFLFISHMKNESLIERSNRLQVNFFLKKPFYMVELLGIVRRLIR